MLTVMILVIVLGGTLLFFLNCVFLNEANRNLGMAASHAQFVMEDIKNTTFADIKTNIDDGYWDWNSAAINSQGLTALRNESIDTQATGTEPLDITVTVSWQDKNGRNRTLNLETLITNS